jgi:hypothetical protein
MVNREHSIEERDALGVTYTEQICMVCYEETVVGESNGDVSSVRDAPVAAEMDSPPLLTCRKSRSTSLQTAVAGQVAYVINNR